MPEVASQTLDLVGRELNNTLAEARTALETFVEQPENVVLMQRCVSDLHQVQGVLRLLEIFGAALLAEEMEQVTRYLLTPASQKNQAETLDALMRAWCNCRVTWHAWWPAAVTSAWCCCRL